MDEGGRNRGCALISSAAAHLYSADGYSAKKKKKKPTY